MGLGESFCYQLFYTTTADALRSLADEVAQQVFQYPELVFIGLDAHQVVSNSYRCKQLAIAVKIPVQAVGVNQVRQGFAIAFLLCLVCVFQVAQANV